MEELSKRKDIIITNSDKEPNSHLSDKCSYKTSQEDPTIQHKKLANGTIDKFKKENLLSKKLTYGPKSVNPKTPKVLHFTQNV